MRLWPFSSSKQKQSLVLPDGGSLTDYDKELMDFTQLNGLQSSISNAIYKQIDISHLANIQDHGNDSGYFGQEFELRPTAGKMKALFGREPWVYATSQLIARTLSSIPFVVKNTVNHEVNETHPLNAQLKAQSPVQDHKLRDWSGYLDMTLGGNYFLVFDENYKEAMHVPVELISIVLIDPETTPDAEKRFNESGPIDYIEISSSGMNNHFLKPGKIDFKQVIHFKLANPYNPLYGLSMYAAASRPILLDRHKNEFEMAFYLRGGTNAGVIETTEDISRMRMERLMRTYEASFTGKRNWWRQQFLPKGAKWVNAGLNMSEMQHLEGLRENRRTLLAMLGIPPAMVGIVEDVNRATAEVQEQAFWQNTIIPLSYFVAAGWNNSYLVKNIYKGEVEVVPDLSNIDAVVGSLRSKAEDAKSIEDIATINEQRELVGLKPLKATDPRGTMFTSQVKKLGMALPFGNGDGTGTIDPNDMGPDETLDTKSQKIAGLTTQSDGDNPHHHVAEWDPETGNGLTRAIQGEGPDHIHKIVDFKVMVAGEDKHGHPGSLKQSDDSIHKEIFKRAKITVEANQRRIETRQGEKYVKALAQYFNLMFEQTKDALIMGLDVEGHLMTLADDRVTLFDSKMLPIILETQDLGFGFALSSSRSISATLIIAKDMADGTYKANSANLRFSPADEQAIEAIKQRDSDSRRTTMSQRALETFYRFDETVTENILSIIEAGLEGGQTHIQIASQIANDYGENYSGQAATIARTEILTAVSQGIEWEGETLQQVFTKVEKQWFHVGDVLSNPDARVPHAEFESQGKQDIKHVYRNPITGGELRYPRDPKGGASDVINCRCTQSNTIPHDAQSNAAAILSNI